MKKEGWIVLKGLMMSKLKRWIPLKVVVGCSKVKKRKIYRWHSIYFKTIVQKGIKKKFMLKLLCLLSWQESSQKRILSRPISAIVQFQVEVILWKAQIKMVRTVSCQACEALWSYWVRGTWIKEKLGCKWAKVEALLWWWGW